MKFHIFFSPGHKLRIKFRFFFSGNRESLKKIQTFHGLGTGILLLYTNHDQNFLENGEKIASLYAFDEEQVREVLGMKKLSTLTLFLGETKCLIETKDFKS